MRRVRSLALQTTEEVPGTSWTISFSNGLEEQIHRNCDGGQYGNVHDTDGK